MTIEDKWLRPMEFVRITNDKLEKDGLPTGSLVFIGNLKAFPVSEEDPWTQRIKLLVHKTVDDYIDTSTGIYIIDPASVEKIDKDEHDRIYKLNEERAIATIN